MISSRIFFLLWTLFSTTGGPPTLPSNTGVAPSTLPTFPPPSGTLPSPTHTASLPPTSLNISENGAVATSTTVCTNTPGLGTDAIGLACSNHTECSAHHYTLFCDPDTGTCMQTKEKGEDCAAWYECRGDSDEVCFDGKCTYTEEVNWEKVEELRADVGDECDMVYTRDYSKQCKQWELVCIDGICERKRGVNESCVHNSSDPTFTHGFNPNVCENQLICRHGTCRTYDDVVPLGGACYWDHDCTDSGADAYCSPELHVCTKFKGFNETCVSATIDGFHSNECMPGLVCRRGNCRPYEEKLGPGELCDYMAMSFPGPGCGFGYNCLPATIPNETDMLISSNTTENGTVGVPNTTSGGTNTITDTNGESAQNNTGTNTSVANISANVQPLNGDLFSFGEYRCIKLRGLNETCNMYRPCDGFSQLWCRKGICRPQEEKLGLGDECNHYTECAKDMYCHYDVDVCGVPLPGPGTCAQRVNLGEKCDGRGENPCPYGSYSRCVDGRCTDVGGKGPNEVGEENNVEVEENNEGDEVNNEEDEGNNEEDQDSNEEDKNNEDDGDEENEGGEEY